MRPINDIFDGIPAEIVDVAAEMRRDYLTRPIVRYDGVNGEKSGLYGTYVARGPDGELLVVNGHLVTVDRVYTNETHGEIKWRCFHADPDWPCVECGHHQKYHHDVPGEEFWCEFDNCNCGYHTGR